MRRWRTFCAILFVCLVWFGEPITCLLQAADESEKSYCTKWSDAGGSGAVPYNFRSIDGKLFAGGNLFNPVSHANPPEKIREYLRFLKQQGAVSVIALHVPGAGSEELRLLEELSGEEGLKFRRRRMTAYIVPTASETEFLMQDIREGAYIHCMWGADRTGAVIAKYLRLFRGYSGEEAWKAVINGGSHAGPLGGLKQKPEYKNLVLYFWPEVVEENPTICRIYNLPFSGPK
jgi:hypothetical protein